MEKTPFKVIIAGSRYVDDYELLKRKCNIALSRKLADEKTEVIIVSGTARGADTLGERYAREKGLQVIRVPALWDVYGRKAGYERNKEMADIADAVIVFLKEGLECKGSRMMIEIARFRNLPLKIYEQANNERNVLWMKR